MKAAAALVTGRVGAADLFAILMRWLLGAVFVTLGLNKAIEPLEFLKLVRQYDVLHHHVLLNLVTAMLPWIEIFCGLLLLLGVAVRGAAVLILVMLGSFTAAVLLRALALRETSGLPFCAIKFDCGCGAGEVLICRKLGENFLLMALAAALILWRSHRLCLRCSVFKS
ncbi:MAG: DoxX family membrane protein [Opitutaceae bacterium]|nr:DoxX family membrane protein [Opitutaceae bacterium]